MQSIVSMARMYLPWPTFRAWAPVVACLALVTLVLCTSARVLIPVCALLLFTRPDPKGLPVGEVSALGVLRSVSSWLTGHTDDEAACIDAYLFRIASHRDRAFIGLLGQWVEVPKTWWSLLHQCAVTVASPEQAEAGSNDPVVARAAAEAEARRLKQQRSYAKAAETFARLEAAHSIADDAEAGCASVVQRQRHAEEAGRCWSAAGRPELALAPLRRAVEGAVDLETRQSAAVALAELALASKVSSGGSGDSAEVLSEAMQTLFALAAVEPCRYHGAAKSAASYAEEMASRYISRGAFGEAADVLSSALERASEAAEDDPDEAAWLPELERCILWRFFCSVQRDRGDAYAAGQEAEATLRRLPPVVHTRAAAFVLDVVRAAEDGDVETLEDVCQEFDGSCGPQGLDSWQLDALLQLKGRLVDGDLS